MSIPVLFIQEFPLGFFLVQDGFKCQTGKLHTDDVIFTIIIVLVPGNSLPAPSTRTKIQDEEL